MDVEDSLELLSSHFSNPTVRRYAVARLQQADDEVFIGLWVHVKVSWSQDFYSHLRTLNVCYFFKAFK